jgi:hypothetical protein
MPANTQLGIVSGVASFSDVTPVGERIVRSCSSILSRDSLAVTAESGWVGILSLHPFESERELDYLLVTQEPNLPYWGANDDKFNVEIRSA